MTGPVWLEYAESQIGYHEGANNANRFSADLGYPGEAWCDDFVADCCKKAGFSLPSMSPGCQTGARAVIESMGWAKANHLWIPSWEGKPGDQLVYGWDGPGSSADNMHTGFGKKFGVRGSTGIGVEGNRADQVEYTTFVVGETVLLGVIDLNRLLLGRPTITVKPTTRPVVPKPQPRHPDHPTNSGPTPLQAKRIAEARDLAKIAARKRPVGKGRAALVAARAAINQALGRKAK